MGGEAHVAAPEIAVGDGGSGAISDNGIGTLICISTAASRVGYLGLPSNRAPDDVLELSFSRSFRAAACQPVTWRRLWLVRPL